MSSRVLMLSIPAEMVGCDKTKVPNLAQCLRQVPTGKIMGDMLAPRPLDAPFIPKLYPFMPVRVSFIVFSLLTHAAGLFSRALSCLVGPRDRWFARRHAGCADEAHQRRQLGQDARHHGHQQGRR